MSEWRTQKGSCRAKNHDACGVHVGVERTVAVIVDAAEEGAKAADYAMEWVRQLLTIAQGNEPLTPEYFISQMRRSHGEQRSAGFLCEIAAYAVLVIDSKQQQAWALNCGDCRVGGLSRHGDVHWMTPVHTGANPLGDEFTPQHACLDERHFLTRRLRVSKFDVPAFTGLDDSEIVAWLLATDGYWVPQLLEVSPDSEPEDDASLLILSQPVKSIKYAPDCVNFISITADAPGAL